MRGLDVTAGYQVTWLLMFADYTRYNRSGRAAGVAVFLGLALTALWFMPIGFVAARLAGFDDPGAMIAALGVGWWGALLISLATLTTNFVNIYMSALALRSLRPDSRRSDQRLADRRHRRRARLLSTVWITRFADFTIVLAGLLVPVGGILLAHNFVLRRASSSMSSTIAGGDTGSEAAGRLPVSRRGSRALSCSTRQRRLAVCCRAWRSRSSSTPPSTGIRPRIDPCR